MCTHTCTQYVIEIVVNARGKTGASGYTWDSYPPPQAWIVNTKHCKQENYAQRQANAHSESEPAGHCVMFSQSTEGFSCFFTMHELKWFWAWEDTLDTDCLCETRQEGPWDILMVFQVNKAEEYWVVLDFGCKKKKKRFTWEGWIDTALFCTNMDITDSSFSVFSAKALSRTVCLCFTFYFEQLMISWAGRANGSGNCQV